MKYIIGIDNGSQSSKVCIFDLNGNIVAEGKQSLKPYLLPAPGYVLHPGDDVWESIQVAANNCMVNFMGDVSDIVGVGLCTIRCCRAILKNNGDLAYPIQSWMDVRLASNYDHSVKDASWITTSSGYITQRMTGEFKDTAANYVGAWPIDYETSNWLGDEAQFDEFELPREMLFELVKPNELLGYVTKKASELTGLPQGVPVFATANDKAVEALGAGLLRDDSLLLSLGTYICAMMQGEGVYPGATSFWTNFADLPDKFLYESNGIRRGMWTISWVRDLVFDHKLIDQEQLGMPYEEFLNQEARQVPAGSEGLMTVLDFLAPPHQPEKKGMLIGLDGRHTRAHIYKSVIEAIAMTMKINCDAMTSELGVVPHQVIVTGGGSNSDVMMQVIADVYGISAVKNEVNGCASLGAAINASIGLGIFDNFAIATEQMVRKGTVYVPNQENYQIYNRTIEEVYKKLINQNYELLQDIYNIFS